MTDPWRPPIHEAQQPPAAPYGWPQPPTVQPPTVRRTGSTVPLVVALAVAAAGLGLLVYGILAASTGLGEYRTISVPGSSMEPTYPPGSTVTAKRIDGSEARRGDVVLFNARDWGVDGLLLKRVIGVGGDHVVIGETGVVSVNGKALREPYVFSKSDFAYGPPTDVTVPAGRLFLLGDHRANSNDSRAHLTEDNGTVARAEVVGMAVDPSDAGSPDRRWTWVGAGTLCLGLVAALVAAIVRRRRTTYVPGF